MHGTVHVDAVVRFTAEAQGETEEDLITAARLSVENVLTRHVKGPITFLRYKLDAQEVRGPEAPQGFLTFHDRQTLDELHWERMDEACIFDFDALVDAKAEAAIAQATGDNHV